MYESSVFNIKIDFVKSHGSYIYDKKQKKYFLDFFGLYSSLPLGYNHPIFREQAFQRSYLQTSMVKVANCEVISYEGEKFFKDFTSHPAMKSYKYFWFCCTGGLAVEAAIKTAIDYKKIDHPIILSLKESFHGISGYASFVTDRFSPVSSRLDGLPKMRWPKIYSPKIVYQKGKIDEITTRKNLSKFENEFKTVIRKNRGKIAAFLIEPIQATFGDNHFPIEFFKMAREICEREDIVLIFDEIQTGFGGSGKMWYWQHTGIEPDIVVFGKKSQVAGIMVKKKYARIFNSPVRLSVTFDGDLSDMIRCRQILKAYTKFNILKNVIQRGSELKSKLQKIDQLKNVRGEGLLLAFDFDTNSQQQEFARQAFKNGLLFNRTRDKTIRLRPNLNVSSDEIVKAATIIAVSANSNG